MSKEQWIGGIHAVRQALNNGSIKHIETVSGKRSKNLLALVADAQAAQIPITPVEYHVLDMRLPNVKHQGIAAACLLQDTPKNWQQAILGTKKPLILILDGIQDPHNLGACLRSALAAGVDAVLLPNSRSADITPVVHKVSCGASENLPIYRVSNLKREIEMMKQQGIWIVGGAGEHAQSLYDTDLTTPLAIIVGNEGEGIRHGLREACDHLAAIPMSGKMESLNVSVACGIILFEARRQRGNISALTTHSHVAKSL